MMPATRTVARVWIEDGCIRCSACHYSAPEVFVLPDGGDAVVRAEVRVDGVRSKNATERAPLANGSGGEFADRIEEAAAGCPVEIIRWE